MRVSAHLGFRLSLAAKARIERAARLRGLPMLAFVRDLALREAEAVVAAAHNVTLSPVEFHRFLDALDQPFKPKVADSGHG